MRKPAPIGETFDNLKVIEEVPTAPGELRRVACECLACGNPRHEVLLASVVGHRVKSCGCKASKPNPNKRKGARAPAGAPIETFAHLRNAKVKEIPIAVRYELNYWRARLPASIDVDDLLSVAMDTYLGVSSTGAPATYIRQTLRWQMIREIEKLWFIPRDSRRVTPLRAVYFEDKPEGYSEDTDPRLRDPDMPIDELCAAAELRQKIRSLVDRLPPQEAVVFRYQLADESQTHSAQELGITKQRVNEIYTSGIGRLAKWLRTYAEAA